MTGSNYFHTTSYLLSRFAFLGTHLDFAIWLVFIFNDPFHFAKHLPVHVPTLDSPTIKPADQCTPLIHSALYNNLFFFALWWGTHSGMARTAYKRALGLVDHPLERPLFAAVATIMWFVQIYTWQPITDCVRWNVVDTSLHHLVISGLIMTLGTVLIVGLLWTLPDHVFGTGKHKYPQGQFPPHKVIRGFPYGLVRHPAAAGFLWCYWALPALTPNHLLLAGLWTVFIVVGTLAFEETGILDEKTEFGREYAKYRQQVTHFFPTASSVLKTFGCKAWDDHKTA